MKTIKPLSLIIMQLTKILLALLLLLLITNCNKDNTPATEEADIENNTDESNEENSTDDPDSENNDDDDGNETDTEDIIPQHYLNLITGLLLIGEDGNPQSFVGNYSNKDAIQKPTESNDMTSNAISIYPNPYLDYCYIQTPADLKNIWFVKGERTNEFNNVDFSNIAIDTTNLSVSTELLLTDIPKGNIISLNTSNLEEGFYKVIMETEDNELVWFSTYKKDVSSENPIPEWYEYWN